MNKRRVILLWIQPLLRDSLQNVLNKFEDVELIGSWAFNAEAIARLPIEKPDVVLLAKDKDDEEGMFTSLTTQILLQHPNTPIVQIGLRENTVHLLLSQTLPARTFDLIDIIRGLPTYPYSYTETVNQP